MLLLFYIVFFLVAKLFSKLSYSFDDERSLGDLGDCLGLLIVGEWRL